MQYIRNLIIVAIVIFSSCDAREAPSCSGVLQYAEKSLPHSGVLQNSSGFVYVKVDDEYIHKLIPYIQKEGFEEPPYFGNENLVGAHITVVYPDEMKTFEIKEIQESGKIIHFTPKRCEIVQPPKWQDIEEVYFIVIESPELDLIRAKYGLPKREYEFHITIGVKPQDHLITR